MNERFRAFCFTIFLCLFSANTVALIERSYTPQAIAIDFVGTWLLGLIPPLVVRYILVRKPLSRMKAGWAAAGFSFFFFALFRWVHIVNDFEPSSGYVWFLVFFIARWILSGGKRKEQTNDRDDVLSSSCSYQSSNQQPDDQILISAAEKDNEATQKNLPMKERLLTLLRWFTPKRIAVISITLPIAALLMDIIVQWQDSYHSKNAYYKVTDVRSHKKCMDDAWFEYGRSYYGQSNHGLDLDLIFLKQGAAECNMIYKPQEYRKKYICTHGELESHRGDFNKDKANKCDASWAQLVIEKQKTPFSESLSSSGLGAIDILTVMLFSIPIFALLIAPHLFSRCQHSGWKRIAIVTSFIVTAAITTSAALESEENIGLVIFYPFFLAYSVTAILGCREIYFWVQEGFSSKE